jgi:uncharacterized protein YceK
LRRIRPLAAALALLVTGSGCMSLDTQLDAGYKGPYVYSGVRKDLAIMGPAFLHLSFGWVLITLFDLPFSLVSDTLLLPVSLSRDAKRDEEIHETTQVERDRPPLVTAKPGEAPADTAKRLFEACRTLMRRQDDQLSDCWTVGASIAVSGAPAQSGSAWKLVVREAMARGRDAGVFVDWRDPVYTPEGERVRVAAVRRSTGEPAESPIVLVVAAGADGGWRIVEESSVGWPER